MKVERLRLPDVIILYSWSEDATIYPFSFGDTIDIEVILSDKEDGIPYFELQEAISLSRGITISEPPELMTGETILWDISEPLEIRWFYADDEFEDEDTSRSLFIEIRFTSYDNSFFETLFCKVENDGLFIIDSSYLEFFDLKPIDPETGDPLFLTQNLQIDLQLQRGELYLPGNGYSYISSTISISGPMTLVDTANLRK